QILLLLIISVSFKAKAQDNQVVIGVIDSVQSKILGEQRKIWVYVPDGGGDLYRRSLYTYIKRQAPPPSLLTFDGPTREKCTMRRSRTNTPLQALQLLNDDTYVEASRVLAERVLRESGDDEVRLRQLWQRVLVREPGEEEIELLLGLLGRQRERFGSNPESAARLLSIGAAHHDTKLDAQEHATWTIIAQSVLNLDETLSRR
ncbi:MAG TPA: DUF1553 domain-containing protein, partial [Verrucomicrobiales bacterium]|nr:DUF1553 domain-containing protein [Verrucomicrobiales bacterium]